MLTHELWELYKTVKTETSIVPPYNYIYTEREVARNFLITAILTPVSLILDIITLPFQLAYLISIKLISHIIERQRG